MSDRPNPKEAPKKDADKVKDLSPKQDAQKREEDVKGGRSLGFQEVDQ